MNGYWFAANLTFGLHMAVLSVLPVGVALAALGALRRYYRISVAFWVSLFVAALWQPLPSCILTDVERWLRHRVEPEWDRTASTQRVMVREVTGADLDERLFWWVGLAVVILGTYAFWRYHRDHARKAYRWLRGRSR
jgi:hypothetical protein